MIKTQVVSIRIKTDLFERINAVTKNISKFFVEAAEEKLNPVKVPELSSGEKRKVLKDTKTITDIMRDAIIQRLQIEEGLLDSMPKDEFLKLVMARLPKEADPGADIEKDILSLRSCLVGLPDLEDITKELSRVKGELYKAEHERDMNIALLKHSKNKVELSELMELVYCGAVEYTANMIARKSIPVAVNGGGLSDKAYRDIAQEIKAELERLNVYRG